MVSGERVGPYTIVGKLGEGGMGAVFRARDSKLDRDVAIKVLPEAFAHDAERLARFTREAKTLAALNHTNIAHIHGLEESGGITALVMELVEGDDLSQRITKGAIPIDEALPVAKQIAEALEAAHEQGIIHRDLTAAGTSFEAGPPVTLFPTRIVNGGTVTQNRAQYTVARDGRFLIKQPVADATAPPITLILNWKGDGQQQ